MIIRLPYTACITLIGFFLVLSLNMEAMGRTEGPPLWGVALDGYPITEERLKQVEIESGLSSDIIVFFLQWPSLKHLGDADFPGASLDAIWNRGAVPCLTWEPMHYEDARETTIPYEHIIRGSYDQYIRSFARKAASWEKPFMIRFSHEMNIERYHWGTEKQKYGPESPGIYKQMFRYVVSLFRKEGAHNVLWVFCPNAESVPNPSYDPMASWNKAGNYYPGDAYVDILGMDGYNWGTSRTRQKHGWDSQWRSFQGIFQPLYKEMLSLAPRKPILIFETASVALGGDKTLWIKEAFETLKDWNVKGVIWFQAKKDNDWRINSDGSTYYGIVRSATSFSQYWIRRMKK